MNLAFNLVVALATLAIEGGAGYPGVVFTWIGHPVIWLGALIRLLERRLNDEAASIERRRRAGSIGLAVLVVVAGALALALQMSIVILSPRVIALLILGILASPCLSQKSLGRHVGAVRDALDTSGVAAGRAAVRVLVTCDASRLDTAGVCRLAIASLAETFATSVVAPALYLGLGGLPGAVVYKSIDTADSMIGRGTLHHEGYGEAAAKADRIVTVPAAYLSGLWIMLAAFIVPGASGARAWRILRFKDNGRSLPVRDWPRAAMAGALGIRLGSSRVAAPRLAIEAGINGEIVEGDAASIGRALLLYRVACALNAVGLLLFVIVVAIV